MVRTLHSGFLRSTKLYSERPAVELAGTTLTYQELHGRAASLAATLKRWTPPGGPRLTGVFVDRSATAYAGVLGSLLAGTGYVPLNPTFPPDRTRTMLVKSGCRAVIVDSVSEPQLDQVLEGFGEQLLLILPDRPDRKSLAKRWPTHIVLGSEDFEPAEVWGEETVPEGSIAYLLFTSGSTGVPKGVMVSHRNVTHFVDTMVSRYGITEQDRFSQTFDVTFDPSAFDMFVAWERGACVCCPSRKTLINSGRFIQDSRLTVWFSVPSIGVFMKRLRMLKPNQYPNLRWSLFCGEPLPTDIAEAWAKAAPNGVVENLYGPTELTIACSLYRWNPLTSLSECERGWVPIGKPFPGMDALIVDKDLKEVPPGAEGELLMTGPQMTLGYLRDPQKTSAAFVVPAGQAGIYYRTGDWVRRPQNDGPMTYLGRLDHQIKVQGYRVELGEVEAYLRKEAAVEGAVAVGWPLSPSGAEGIVAFVDHPDVDVRALRNRLKAKLPPYAVPREIHLLPELPVGVNGKVDRKALLKILTLKT